MAADVSITFFGWESVYDHHEHLRNTQEPKGHLEYTMYHGTHKQNARNIVISGFKRSKGGLLGAGVYVSRNVRKAMCYPQKTRKDEKVVFKLRVKVGKVKRIDCDDHPLQMTWHENGYDTAWVPRKSNISAIKSGREEDCVWDPKSIQIVGVSYCEDARLKEELIRLIVARDRGSTSDSAREDICRACDKRIDGFHHIFPCWACGKLVCPFLGKHKCRRVLGDLQL